MIGVKQNKLNMFVHILVDSEPDASMIVCKSDLDAGKLVYNYYLEAMKELEKQFTDALDKIRSKQ